MMVVVVGDEEEVEDDADEYMMMVVVVVVVMMVMNVCSWLKEIDPFKNCMVCHKKEWLSKNSTKLPHPSSKGSAFVASSVGQTL